jgi:radical SAM protein
MDMDRTRALRELPTPFDERPLLVIWETTQACDLACVHCRACAIANRDPAELTTAEAKKLLDDVKRMGTPLFVLTGGDPAKRPDLVEIVRYGSSIGLIMAVTPSGTPLMTRNILGELRDAGMARLAVSVDGYDAAIHDAFRRVRGSFENTMRILEDARALGVERQINTTITPHNKKDLRAMADLVIRMGATLWSVFTVVPTGRADAHMVLPPDDMEAMLVELAGIAENAPFDVKTTAAPMFRRVVMERRAKVGPVGVLRDLDAEGHVRGPRGVNDGVGMLFVSHKGDVFPSGFLPLKSGNVRSDDVGAIYRDSPVFRSLRDVAALEGKCGACPFKRVCGGARSRAYATSGNLHASDLACAYVPKGYIA